MQSERTAKQKTRNIDWITIVIVLALVSFSVITIANVMAEPFTGNEAGFQDIREKLNLEFVQRQIINFIVGVAACLVITALDYQIYKPLIKYVYVANILLLLALWAVSDTTRGVLRWYYIGSFALQPSELCKITLTVSLSKIASDAVERDGALRSLKDILLLLANFLVPFAIVFLQPDLGTALVFAVVFAAIVFVSKISWKYILAAVAALAAIVPLSYFYLLNDDQVKRIQVFLNPDSDLQGAGMHVSLSKIAAGSGQLMGKGYFSEGTLAQLKFVPERQTDFIFTGVAEGLGFVGGTILIVAYFLLIFRWLWVAFRAKDHFGTCLVIGITAMMAAHVFENIGMTIGLMPVTGIPLPFMSYGGSNMLTNMVAVGIVLNVWLRRLQKSR